MSDRPHSRSHMLTASMASVLSVVLSSAIYAQGTAFTYQGRLTDNGNPATGLYDFEFRLFDALSDGNQKGTTLTLTNVSVTNGTFTVQLAYLSLTVA